MNRIPLNARILIIFCLLSCILHLGYELDPEDANLSAIGVIEKYGYPAELHRLETEDGYILELHRIPHGKTSNSIGKIPILLEPGLFATSGEFIGLGNQSLGFLLADTGYDVWLGNFRGNKYTRRHKYLSPEGPKFWDFTFQEHGEFDLTATIDYIRNHTGSNDLLLLCYSMSSTAYFVMASTRPEYQEKIRGVLMMGPVATIKSTKCPVRIFAPFSYAPKILHTLFPTGEFTFKDTALKNFSSEICAFTEDTHMCRSFIFFITGSDASQFDEEIIPILEAHYFYGTSIKNMAHYGQIFSSGKFEQFDYGLFTNRKKYHRLSPPNYNLKSIKTPLSLFLAPNDYFVCKEDLRYLLKRLNCVKSFYIVPNNQFTHLDFSLAKDAKSLVYEKVLEQLEFLVEKGKDAKSIDNFDDVFDKMVL